MMMLDNTNPQANLEYIRDLLSPYLDGEVSEEEQALVEQAVANSTELRQELESLRQTVALVKALPPMAAPRPFTLTEADVQPVARRSFWFSLQPWVSGLAVAAAVLVCVLAAGGLFLNNGLAPQSELAQAPAPEAATLSSTTIPAEAEADMAANEAPEAAAEAAVEEAAPTSTVAALAQEAAPAERAASPEVGTFAFEEETTAAEGAAESQAAAAERAAEPAETAAKSMADNSDQITTTESATNALAAPADEPTLAQPPAPEATPAPEAEITMAQEATEKEAPAEAGEAAMVAPPAADEAQQEEETVELRIEEAPVQAEEATATFTPTTPPSPTPRPTQTPAPTSAPTPATEVTAPDDAGGLTEGWVLVLLAILILAGVIIWFRISRR